MHRRRTILTLLCALYLALPSNTAAAARESVHEHANDPEHRRSALTQAASTPLGLENLEQMALRKNPTLLQAEAQIRAAQGRTLQSGLYPNPMVGATGDENSPGPTIRGGEFGGFFEQRIVTGGKLKRRRSVFQAEERQAIAEAEEQKLRVLNAVRVHYYEALGAARVLDVRSELVENAGEAARITRDLANVGQADQSDVLAAEIEARRAVIAHRRAKNNRHRIWRMLAAVVGDPSLAPQPLRGSLEMFPTLEPESQLLAGILDSPEWRFAEAGMARSESALARAKAEKTPDLLVRGGLRYNRELLSPGRTPVGLEGFFDIGVRLPLFDRNQGNIAAARAEVQRAENELRRVQLSLRSRLAGVYADYRDALVEVEEIREQILPKARQAHELYAASFRKMAAAYPQVLIARRNLFQVREEYVEALIDVWRSVVLIQGRLVSGGLTSPANVSGGE